MRSKRSPVCTVRVQRQESVNNFNEGNSESREFQGGKELNLPWICSVERCELD